MATPGERGVTASSSACRGRRAPCPAGPRLRGISKACLRVPGAACRSPHLWKDPDTFRPERFTGGNPFICSQASGTLCARMLRPADYQRVCMCWCPLRFCAPAVAEQPASPPHRAQSGLRTRRLAARGLGTTPMPRAPRSTPTRSPPTSPSCPLVRGRLRPLRRPAAPRCLPRCCRLSPAGGARARGPAAADRRRAGASPLASALRSPDCEATVPALAALPACGREFCQLGSAGAARSPRTATYLAWLAAQPALARPLLPPALQAAALASASATSLPSPRRAWLWWWCCAASASGWWTPRG